MATDFSAILRENLVGIYLWGSLTYQAFDEACSDVDCIGVTRRDLDEREFSELDDWFKKKGEHNRWVKRIDMRFVIDQEFLDKSSRCCGFYHYTGKLVRHGSDGNPIIWMNIGSSGITLWGKDAKLIGPQVSGQCLNDALLLELNYLKEDLGLQHRRSVRQGLHPQCLRGPHRLPNPLFGPSQGTSFQRPSLWLGDGNGPTHLVRDYSWR
jgi:hypothetical protein